MDRKQQHKRDLLRRWISGDITAKEEGELRQAAREDELLRDALAGYDQHAEADHAGSIKRLRSQLAPKAKGRVRTLYMWQAAAAVLLLLAVSWWLFTPAFENAMAPTMAADQVEERSAAKDAITETAESAPSTPVKPTVPASAPAEQVEREPNFPQSISETPIASRIEAEELQEPAPIEDSIENFADFTLALDSGAGSSEEEPVPSDAEADVLEVQDDAEVAYEVAPSAPPAPPISQTYSSPAQNQGFPARIDDRTRVLNSGAPVAQEGFRIIEGTVMDSEGYPLIGATVLEYGTSNGTVTDFDGYYRLTVPLTGATLAASYTGFDIQQVAVGGENQVNIVLQEGTVLDEVVVTELGESRRQKRINATGTAAPEEGFRALKRYIDGRTPVNTPRARIRLQFVLQADGQLTDFQVLNSTNTALNNFAIELLQNGPAWEVTEGTAPLRVVYTVKLKG